MTRTATKSSDLAKRVKRFLSRERDRDRVLLHLLDCLNSLHDVYLFGGVLRDIALFGIERLESDIDLVSEGSRDQIRSVVEANRFRFTRNKFDGFRVETERWFVDIWSAEDTWAFRKGGRRYDGIESLLSTTITNWESILCRLNGCRLIHGENYFKDINDRYLHVVFDKNPNPLSMYVRILRTYAYKDTAVLSSKAAWVLNAALRTYSFEDLSAYERVHYPVPYIRRAVYELFRDRVQNPDLLPVKVREPLRGLPLGQK